jgi:hypothetical protein
MDCRSVWQAVCSYFEHHRSGEFDVRTECTTDFLMLGDRSMATKTNPQKIVDLPPKGDRNPDPIINEPGSHPIETAIGAAAAGAAAGMAVGAFGGPIAGAVGAIAGAVAGGYAGKGIGEMIDPTIEDTWLRDNFEFRPYVQKDETFATYQPVYRYGAQAEAKYGDAGFDAIVDDLEKDWAKSEGIPGMTWPKVRDAVKDSYERTVQIRRARDVPEVRDDQLDD